ncbi:MAG: YwiC-like family protein [Gemmatimonadota bacterium]
MKRVNLRSVALPVEHGGWSFLAEPVLLGLLLAPSGTGMAIAVATISGFLARHPGRMYWKNRHRSAASPRYEIARRFALSYAFLAAAALVVAGATAGIRPSQTARCSVRWMISSCNAGDRSQK